MSCSLLSSIKDAGLLSQAAGLVQEVVQGLIFLEFRGLQSLCLKRLIGLYSIVPKTRPGDGASGLARNTKTAPPVPVHGQDTMSITTAV